MHIGQQFVEAFNACDINALSKLFKQEPKLLKRRITGGDLLYRASLDGSLELMQYLIGIGFDVHSRSQIYRISTLTAAARRGHVDVVEFLLDEGVTLDTETALQNPLFAAVSGGDIEVVNHILRQGIDASISYTSDTMVNMNAVGFAFWNFKDECGEIIIEHLTEGDNVLADKIRSAAKGSF